MTEIGQEFHAEGMDCAEEGTVERSLHFLSQIFLEQSLSGALLHFVRRTIGEGDHDQTRQNFRGVRRTRDRQNAVQFAGKTSAYRFIARLHHVSHSSFSRTRLGCVSAHLSSKMSLSIGNVASGYGAL